MTSPSRLSRRVAAIAESATLAVDAKAKALKAAGEPVIGFAAGEPDFPTPGHIVAAAVAAAQDPANHRYSPTAGLPELRACIAQRTSERTGVPYRADQVLVTNGGKQAVFTACATLLNPGDEVLLPTPAWTSYQEAVTVAGGVVVPVVAGSDTSYKVSVDALEKACTERTTTLLLNSPANPTGAVYTCDEVAAIASWAHERDLWVLSDDIYADLTYDGAVATPLLTVEPGLADRVVMLDGVAKTYAMTGWRVGWLTGPADVVAAATNLQSHLTSNVNNIAQRAALAALSGDPSPVAAMREAFDRRRRTMLAMLADVPGVVCPVPQGAFYVYADVRGLLGRSIRGRTPTTSAELAELVLDEAKVAVVPGEAFGPSGYLRLSYALSDADLAEGLSRMVSLLKEAR